MSIDVQRWLIGAAVLALGLAVPFLFPAFQIQTAEFWLFIVFAVIAIGMLLASLLLAAGLAYWLTRRIRAIEQAAHALIRGDYDIALEVPGNDELARLASDVNTLARTLDAARRSRQERKLTASSEIGGSTSVQVRKVWPARWRTARFATRGSGERGRKSPPTSSRASAGR